MLLLAIDTSGAAVTAALHDGAAVRAERSLPGARGHAENLAPLVAEVLAAAGAGRSDLTGVVVGVGPGPFTGLRVGLVTARVLGHVLGVGVVGVCSLDAVAADAVALHGPRWAADGTTSFLVATDARRREVHWAAYRLDPCDPPPAPDAPPAPDGSDGASLRAVRVDGPHVAVPADVPVDGRPVVGRGALLYPDLLRAAGADDAQQDTSRDGERDGEQDAEPLDVRAGALAALAVRGLRDGADAADRAVLLPPEPLYLRRPDAVEPGARKRVLR